MPKVGSKSADDVGAPALAILAVEDLAANLPVEENLFAIDGKAGLQPGRTAPVSELSGAGSDTTTSLDWSSVTP